MTARIFVLGAGRAGRGLARALRASGVVITGLHGTRAQGDGDDGAVSAGRIPEHVGGAEIVLVTVQDARLERALDELANAPLAPGAVVLHASGSSEPAALDRLRAMGHPCGTFHPLVSLAEPARAAEQLRRAWIGVDGDERARQAAERLADRLGARALRIPDGQKGRYHAAAVFAANFPTVLAAIAIRLLREAGIPEGDGWAALRGLMSATVVNLQESEPADALTGPIVRGDVDTVMRHLRALANDPYALDAYVVLSRAALPLAEQAGTEPALLRSIDLLLGGSEG